MLRPKKKDLHKSMHFKSQDQSQSFDATSSHLAVPATTARKTRIAVRSQPRIHKRIEQFRRMNLKQLRNDKDFMADVDECLKNILELPALRKQMQSMFSELEETMIEAKAKQSIEAAKKVRQHLVSRKQREEAEYNKQVEKIVEATSRTNAARAMRLGKLLNKQWYECHDQFKVVSGLNPKEKERISVYENAEH